MSVAVVMFGCQLVSGSLVGTGDVKKKLLRMMPIGFHMNITGDFWPDWQLGKFIWENDVGTEAENEYAIHETSVVV